MINISSDLIINFFLCKKRFYFKYLKSIKEEKITIYDIRKSSFLKTFKSLSLSSSDVVDNAIIEFKLNCAEHGITFSDKFINSLKLDYTNYFYAIKSEIESVSRDLKFSKNNFITVPLPNLKEFGINKQYNLLESYDYAVKSDKGIILYVVEANNKSYTKEHLYKLRFLLYLYFIKYKKLPIALGYIFPLKKKVKYLDNFYYKELNISNVRKDIIQLLLGVEEQKFPCTVGKHCVRCSLSTECNEYQSQKIRSINV